MSAALLLGCGAAPETEDVGEASLAIVTLYVNTPADGPDASPGDGLCATATGQCSLRAAIMEANAIPGHDTIYFAIPDPLAPIVLTITGSGPGAGDLDITDAVSIISKGPRRRTIDALVANDRVFDIDIATAFPEVHLEGLTITRGRSSPFEDGGGIRAKDGEVLLKNVGVKRNSSPLGGGVSAWPTASVTLNRVDIEDNAGGNWGGGAYLAGPANIVDANIARNRARDGGGLIAYGTVTLDRVTIAGNSASFRGGAALQGASSSLRNVTVSDNTGSVGLYFGGAASIVESTIADNAKNVDRCTTCAVSVERSIIANGPGFTGPSCVQPLVSQGKNLDSDNTCGFNASGDIPGVDPMLEPLGYSMGHTQTRGLEPGSPAIDAAGATCKSKGDQRGVPRPQAGGCDIGAFEVQPPTFVVVSGSDWPDSNPGDGVCRGIKSSGCTLRAAIMETNALPGPNTIALNLTAPVVLERAGANEDGAYKGDLDITDNLTIRGQNWQTARIDGNGTVIGDRIFDIDPGETGISVLLADMVLDNGRADYEGGGIRNNEGARVALAYVLVRGNSLADPYISRGGGLNNQGYAEARDFTWFYDNDAGDGDGGGVFNSGDLLVVHSSLTSNAAGYRGGGLRNLSGRATLWFSEVSYNDSANDSGGISNTGDLVIWQSAVDGNTAVHFGAGIRNQVSTATLQIEESSVSENIGALSNSAGIASAGFVSATNVTISGNQGDKGGLDLSGGADLRHMTIVGNTFGITAGPGVTMTSSIIAGSTFGPNCVGTVTSGGRNIDSGSSCGFTMPADMVNQNPMLGALAYSGGYSRTHALDPASPAIDFAHPGFCPATDQRGFPRPANGVGCDTGAFER